MKTLMTIKQQNDWIKANHINTTIEHKWSARGYGNSKMLNALDDVLAKAGGCGYDRFGAAYGELITALFPEELYKLAKRECKGPRNAIRCGSDKFYGLFLNKKDGYAHVYGACGSNCMERILNKIGFQLRRVGETKGSVSGSEFYIIEPVDRRRLQWL